MRSAGPVTAIALLFAAHCAFGQGYPKGPVRVIVPFPAGGGVDTAARILGQKLAEGFGKPFVIENRGGANGNIGTEAAAKSPNDGYTLLFTGAGLVTNPSLYKTVPYDPVKDFEPVSLMAIGPNVLVVHPSLPVKSVRELISLARAQPGKIGFAGSGSGSTPHLAGELFNLMAGVQMVHIPYHGSGPAMIGLLAGEVPVMFLPAINVGGHVTSGRLRAIAVTSRERLPAMPDLPTVSEAGLNGYESSQWYGLLAPAGTPAELLNLLNAQVARIMQSADMKVRMTNDGLVPIGGSREQFAAHIQTEVDNCARVIAVIDRVDRLLQSMVWVGGLLFSLLLFGLFYSLSTSRRRALRIAEQMTKDLKAVSHRLVEVQEAERRLLATELHDRAGPSLTALGINLSMVANSLPVEAEPRLAARLEECASLVAEAVDAMRDVMRELRPLVLDDYGLVAALRSLATRFSRRTGIDVVFDGNDSRTSPPKTIDLALFRIAQEALNNVAKHSKANRVEIAFSCANGAATLRVSDEGVGFDPRRIEASNPGLGLIIMRERAKAVGAKFELKASPGAGVQVLVESLSGNATA
jgi:tripartite-type tricarboxylate transporter receptor subunit TctC/two-component sensor histidine kinase